MTIPHLDRDGFILYGAGPELWATVAPRRPELLPTISGLVREWLLLSLVSVHASDEGDILRFEGFKKNQVGMNYEREAQSRYRIKSGAAPDLVWSSSGLSQAEVKVEVEVEGKVQVQVQGEALPTTPHDDDDKAPALVFASASRTDAQKRIMKMFQDVTGQIIWNAPKKVAWLDDMTAGAGEERMQREIAGLAEDIRAGRLIPYNALGALSDRLKASRNGNSKSANPQKRDRFALDYDPATVVEGLTVL